MGTGCKDYYNVTDVGIRTLDGHASSTLTTEDKIFLVETACSPKRIFNSDSYHACDSLCEERKCCFADAEHTCYTSNSKWCDEYAACKKLQKYSGVDNFF